MVTAGTFGRRDFQASSVWTTRSISTVFFQRSALHLALAADTEAAFGEDAGGAWILRPVAGVNFTRVEVLSRIEQDRESGFSGIAAAPVGFAQPIAETLHDGLIRQSKAHHADQVLTIRFCAHRKRRDRVLRADIPQKVFSIVEFIRKRKRSQVLHNVPVVGERGQSWCIGQVMRPEHQPCSFDFNVRCVFFAHDRSPKQKRRWCPISPE